MKTFEIEVTQDDIERGVPGDAFVCPLALACLRAIPMFLSVSPWTLEIGPPNDGLFVPLPDMARQWCERFDGGQTVSPLRFSVKIEDFV